MPELPEVETVRRGLQPALEGRKIVEALAYCKKLRLPIPPDFSRRLEGAVVERVWRRAKYLILSCDKGLDVILHLGMSGHMRVLGHNRAAGWVREKHDHLTFRTDHGDLVVFTDPRRFGLVAFHDRAAAEPHPLLANIGPEPIGPEFDAEILGRGLAGRKTAIKVALLDQKIVAGIGNIYASEALFRAGISPRRKAGSVSVARLQRLAPAIQEVLEDAIAAGGSSLQDHAQVSGELGYFQHSFQVYEREGEACLQSGCGGTVRRIVQGARSTYFCPHCQR